MIRSYLQAVVVTFCMLHPCTSISAGPNGVESDPDSSPEANNVITDSLTFGGKFQLNYEQEQNFDIDSSQHEDIGTLKPSAEFALEYQPRTNMFGYLLFELSKEYPVVEEDKEIDSQMELDLVEAYLTLSDDSEKHAIQVGRQRFKDSREWYFDDQLDAARVFFEKFNLDIDASISRTELFGRDLINHDDADRTNNLVVSARYKLNKHNSVTGFLVLRDDRSNDDEDPIFVGVRAEGRAAGKADYWADIAAVGGSDNEKTIRGYGYDLGATFNIESALEHYITVAYAFGSGDANTEDNTDKQFRQTGLQDNSAKLGGVTKLQYYGELLNPELSNIGITTLGIGMRPTRKSSVDFLYHHYRQDNLSDRLRSPLDENPDGESREIGSEIDLVFGYLAAKKIKYEMAIGYFMPGDAFSSADNASFARIEVEYRF